MAGPVVGCSSCLLSQTDQWLAIVATLAFSLLCKNLFDYSVELFHPSAI